MKFRIASLAIAPLLLSGCISTKLTPPSSDYVGNLPDAYKVELNKLNDVPSTPFRGGVQTFQFDEENSLLTVIYRLPNPRWYWNTHKSQAEKDIFPYVCEQFGGAIENGLGVRYWYSGNGGFATDVVTAETCHNLSQPTES
ncbi:hypothetical protein MD588_14825 [Photobacterium sp. SDRW27]|uniref:hypothetical protein n=1 Tax=Photobacterium obscurum TaxID=2829490 RepID=UPI002244574D|nr:hypothetical protein [Photobacterium obscurum]MCW8330080.1 hypothetical protein [Photobacterium obscurum]